MMRPDLNGTCLLVAIAGYIARRPSCPVPVYSTASLLQQNQYKFICLVPQAEETLTNRCHVVHMVKVARLVARLLANEETSFW